MKLAAECTGSSHGCRVEDDPPAASGTDRIKVMKLLFDFFPILLFFITFKLHDDPKEGILAATAVIIVATLIQVSISWFRNRRIEKLHLITLILVIVFGGITLILEDEIFIKWKVSVVNWLFGAAFLASEFFGKKSFIRRLMDQNVSLPDPVWTRLNLMWTTFFILMGFLNLYVIYNFDTEAWVNFKFYGQLGLTFLFVIGQGFYLMRHIKPDDGDAEENS